MAEGYARSRPALHPLIVERIGTLLGIALPVERVLDVGCGSGLSTVPWSGRARCVIGMEPVAAMLPWTRITAPGLPFVAGRAEALPFAASSIDILTAAGSLNYVDLARFFPEADRVLGPDGALAIYDFSQGFTSPDTPRLEAWYREFLTRYPAPVSDGWRPLSPESLAASAAAFRLYEADTFLMPLAMDAQRYLDYMMTEANIAAALRKGESPEDIREWCRTSLAPVFDGRPLRILFPGYIACLRRR